MKRASMALAAALVLTLATGQGAKAGYIDFTDNLWAPELAGDSANSRTRNISGFGNVTIEAFNSEGNPGTLTFIGGVPGNPAMPCGFLACDNDGAGINNDEVSFGVGAKEDVERLVVSVEKAFKLDKIHFLDLFAAGAANDPETETAQWQINGNGTGGTLDGTATDNVGYAVTASLGYPNVTQIEFFADTFRAASSPNSDFALAAIQKVPGPATILMLAGGLLALGGGVRMRRHRRA